MPTNDILWLLKNYIILSLKVLIPIVILFLIGYFLVYKKILKGRKIIKKSQIVLYSVSICYVVIVIGATFFSRTPSDTYNDKMNLNLFSSYVEAYHNIGVVLLNNVLLRNLILNIILFIPLGLLLPMYSDKFKKMYIVVTMGLLATLTIEFTQHFNDYGTFEIDDALNNTIGTLLGYCIFMIVYTLKNKDNWKRIIGYSLPIVITIGVFVGILVGHKNQEFGNFDFENNYTIDMSGVSIQSKIELSSKRNEMQVYKTNIITREEARKIAVNLYNKLGKENDESLEVEQENLVVFKPKRENFDETDASTVVYYIGGRYSCSESSNIIVKENGTIEFVEKANAASREEVELALQKLGVKVPENAEFNQDKSRGQYVFTMDMVMQDEKMIDGEIRCDYYIDKTIKYFENNIVIYDVIIEKKIMSEEEAYQEILKGKFKAFTIDEIKSIIVNDLKLEYKLDSKGYYVPVYKFEVLLNGNNSIIYIKAIQ